MVHDHAAADFGGQGFQLLGQAGAPCVHADDDSRGLQGRFIDLGRGDLQGRGMLAVEEPMAPGGVRGPDAIHRDGHHLIPEEAKDVADGAHELEVRLAPAHGFRHMQPSDEPRQRLSQQFGGGTPLLGDRHHRARFFFSRGLLEAHGRIIHAPLFGKLQPLDRGLAILTHAHALGRAHLGFGLVGLICREEFNQPSQLPRRVAVAEQGTGISMFRNWFE